MNNLQLEAAFATPEGQRVVKIWKNIVGKFNTEENKLSWTVYTTQWDEAAGLWNTLLGHIAPHFVAFCYWREHYGPST